MKQLAFILFFLFSTFLTNERVGYILNVQGYVKIISDKSNSLDLDAVKGRYIYENDVIRSFKNSLCTIIFLDKSSLISISGNTEISIYNHRLDKNVKKVKVNYGKTYIENASNFEPLYLISPYNQIRCLNSSAYIETSFKMDDIIYTFEKYIDFYNKKSEKKFTLDSRQKAISDSDGNVSLSSQEDGFFPYQIAESVNFGKTSLKKPAAEFTYKKGDLIIDELGGYVLDVYKVPEVRNIKVDATGGGAYIKGNPYTRIAFYPQYKNTNFKIDLMLDYYFKNNDSPNLNVWDESNQILAKIKEINYTNNSKSFNLRTGNLDGVTMGHGLIVNDYKNYFNYPLKSSHGLHLNYKTDRFIDIDFFSSNIEELIKGSGFWGIHTSIFVSKYVPLKLGFGFASDMNQFSSASDQYPMMFSRNIRALEFDVSYSVYSQANYSFKLISEIGALTFPDKHYYKRYNSTGDVASGLKNKSGTWGISAGIQGVYKEFLKIKTLAHYNDPLFLPSFFNRTYDIERYRLLSNKSEYSDITSIDNMVKQYQYNQNDSSSESDLALIPKDMYFAYLDKEFSYPSTGISVDGAFNYYDKILAYFSYTSIFELTNEYSDSKTLSSFNIGLDIGKKVLKNIETIKIDYSKNLSDDIFNFSDKNENTSISLSLMGKLKFGLILDIKFERVNYDYDFNGYADNIDIVDIGLIYRIY